MSGQAAETWYAPAQRTSPRTLDREVSLVTNHPVVDALLLAVDGVLAVLDDNRQIIAVNRTFLDLTGMLDVTEALGLRVGEALDCTHAHDEVHGCGTSRACASCGAVNAFLTAQQTDAPAEKTCALQTGTAADTTDLSLRVRVSPLHIEGLRCYVVLCQDVSRGHRLANLERIFLHDLNNVLQGLRVTSEMLAVESDPRESRSMGRHARRMVEHLTREITLQRTLLSDERGLLVTDRSQVALAHIQAELGRVFHLHPASRGRNLVVERESWNTWIHTDSWVLVRVLTNLVLNALEAGGPGDRVEVRTTVDAEEVVFTVWNRQAIPAELQPRIFQRNFSSKDGEGRGLGTYSARLLTETMLEGRIDFTSDDTAGTSFHVRLPH